MAKTRAPVEGNTEVAASNCRVQASITFNSKLSVTLNEMVAIGISLTVTTRSMRIGTKVMTREVKFDKDS